jgi:hypothetical protein
MSIRKPRGARAAEPRDAVLSPVAYPSCLLERKKAIEERMNLGEADVKLLEKSCVQDSESLITDH